MGSLVKQGKIRGWGMCNDNTYGLMGSLGAVTLSLSLTMTLTLTLTLTLPLPLTRRPAPPS